MPEPNEPDAQAAFNAHLPEAKALPADQILPYRLDPNLALINIKTSMRVIAEHGADIPSHLPKINVAALQALPSLALAVKFGAMEAERAAPSEKQVSETLSEARQIRATLMPVVAGLAATGLVPTAVYEAIARGRGAWDAAEDCVSLAKVFRDGGQKLAGKHSADPAMIERAATLGSWLLQHLRKPGAPAEKAPPPPPEVDVRNRLATLLVKRHQDLQLVAHCFYGPDYERVAPPLMSRQGKKGPNEEPGDNGSGEGQG